jgi:hypothetical protein
MARLFAWGVPNGKWKLCYQKSVDGGNEQTYHGRCDNKGALVSVIKNNLYKVIGGYHSKSIGGSSRYMADSTAFLFSLTNNFKHENKISTYAGYNAPSYGPTYGGGHDLKTNLGQGHTWDNYCNIGHSFKCRTSSYGQIGCRNDFCGNFNGWKVTELEVYYK